MTAFCPQQQFRDTPIRQRLPLPFGHSGQVQVGDVGCLSLLWQARAPRLIADLAAEGPQSSWSGGGIRQATRHKRLGILDLACCTLFRGEVLTSKQCPPSALAFFLLLLSWITSCPKHQSRCDAGNDSVQLTKSFARVKPAIARVHKGLPRRSAAPSAL